MVPPGSLPDAAPTGADGSTRLKNAVGYQIFVRSFADSDADGSGDLRGVIQRLGDLADLGVDLLWLTPIYPSPSYHGYDITDFEAVHPQLGDLDTFDQLLREAHQRHMRVLLDMVLNHTSTQHPWFRAAAADASSPEVGRYLFRGDNPGWRYSTNPSDANPPLMFKPLANQTPPRYYYSVFSGALPDLNFRDPRILPYFKDLLNLWLRRGADGFRLDAARYLVEWPDPLSATTTPAAADTADSHRDWRALRASVEATHGSAVLIGEVWADNDSIASYYGSGKELHAAFAFPFAGAALDAVKRGVAQPVRDALVAQQRSGAPMGYFTPFLSNHDQTRTATVLGDDPARLRLAAALLLGMPGAPFLYYGEEIGLGQSQEAGDRAKRAPMPWDQVARQKADPASLWRWYQRLIAARQRSAALRDDRLQVLTALTSGATPSGALVLLRGAAPTQAMLVYNLSGDVLRGVQVPLPADWPAGTPQDLLGGGSSLTPISNSNHARYPVPDLAPRSALWLTP